jgi:hypothetical protein
MDQHWHQFRKEVPWVKVKPSETVLNHGAFHVAATMEEPEKTRYTSPSILEMIHAGSHAGVQYRPPPLGQ